MRYHYLIIQKIVASLLLAFPVASIAQSLDNYSSVVEKVRPSVVAIQVFDSGGNPLKQGTGFSVGRSLIVTNYHVVDVGSRIIVRTAGNAEYTAQLETAQASSDLALLRTEVDIGTPPLRFAAISPRIGERVLVIGNPLGLSGTVSDGIVSALRPSADFGRLVQITAPISKGSSGSPVVNLKGEVVGIATLNLPGGQNLNFAISSEFIQSIWSSRITTSDLLTAGSKTQTRWRLLSSESISYDVETLSKTKSLVSVWIRYEEKDGTSSKDLTEINCLRNQLRSVRSISYFQNGEVRRQNDTIGKWADPIPGSNGELYFKIFCKNQPNYQHVSDRNRRSDLIEKGSILEDAKKYDEAIATFTELIRDFESDAAYGLGRIGAIRLEEKRYPDSIRVLTEAVRLEPKRDYYRWLLGQAYEGQNKFELAKESFWQALRLNQDSILLGEHDLIRVYERENDVKGKLRVYLYVVSKGRNVHHYIGDLYEKLGQNAEARTFRLSGARKLEPLAQSGKATALDFYSLSSIYLSLGDQAKERVTLSLAIKRFPEDVFLHARLAENYNRAKDWQAAVRTTKNGLSIVTKDYERRILLRVLKVAYVGLGETYEAAEVEAELQNARPSRGPVIIQ